MAGDFFEVLLKWTLREPTRVSVNGWKGKA